MGVHNFQYPVVRPGIRTTGVTHKAQQLFLLYVQEAIQCSLLMLTVVRLHKAFRLLNQLRWSLLFLQLRHHVTPTAVRLQRMRREEQVR